jgi:hypothetical protein
MKDIVERLRTEPPIYGPKSTTQMLRDEAALKIEALRIALGNSRRTLIAAGFCGPSDNGSGDPEINAIDAAMKEDGS